METLDGEIELTKAAFGVELARAAITKPNASSYDVAKSLGLPTALALVASKDWVLDPITEDARKREAEIYTPLVPTKEEVAARILDITKDRDAEAKDRIAALRLVAEMYEYIPKAPPTQVTQNNMNGDIVRNVIQIPERPATWKEDMLERQRKLIANAGA